jgi:hypothetical protein
VKHLVAICLVFLSGALTGFAHSRESNLANPKQYQWQNRLLLIFAPSGDYPAYRFLADELRRQQDGVYDRDVLVFSLLEKGQSRLGDDRLDQATGEALRRRFSIKQGTFAVILIGKDGGEKLSREEGTTLREIFRLIDTMPIRQREMRRKTKR